MSTTVWVITQGSPETKTGTLSDDDGPVDLSQFDSVSVIVARYVGSTPVINAAVTIAVNQVTNKGEFSYAFSVDDVAIDISPKGGYLLSFKAMDGVTPFYFPQNRRAEETYGRLVVQDPLA